MQSIDTKVLLRIYGKHRGWVFPPSAFIDLGELNTIRQVLYRLTKKRDPTKYSERALLLSQNTQNVGSLTTRSRSRGKSSGGK